MHDTVDFQCIVCHDTFVTPVVTHCGSTYCYECISKWFTDNITDPSTNDTLSSKKLINNLELRKYMIRKQIDPGPLYMTKDSSDEDGSLYKELYEVIKEYNLLIRRERILNEVHVATDEDETTDTDDETHSFGWMECQAIFILCICLAVVLLIVTIGCRSTGRGLDCLRYNTLKDNLKDNKYVVL